MGVLQLLSWVECMVSAVSFIAMCSDNALAVLILKRHPFPRRRAEHADMGVVQFESQSQSCSAVNKEIRDTDTRGETKHRQEVATHARAVAM